MKVEEYELLESHGMRGLANRMIEASQCVAFAKVGYPSRIGHITEVCKFSETMQEDRSRATYDMLGGLTAGEFSLVEQIIVKVQKATDRLGRSVTPTASLLRAVVVYRQIAALFPDHASVLEIGPGSGYVSALLALDSYKVYSVEIAQAFALWQRQLRQTMPDADWTHIPWWDWIDGRAPEKLDCITANHCLNEMHPNALAYLIRRAEEILSTTGIMVVESLGSEVVRTNAQTMTMFARRGWSGQESGPAIILLPPGSSPWPVVRHEMKTRTWDDLVNLWGGEVESADERFLRYCDGR